MNPETFASSREAYQWCLEQGIISQRVADVLSVLVDASGPMNQTMAHTAVVSATGNVSLQKYSVSPRFAVLLRMGLIREVGDSPCPITGRGTMFYEATCSRPRMTEAEAMKAPRPKETVAKLKAELAEITKERDQLREILNLRSASHQAMQERLRSAKPQIQTSFLEAV